jgi:PAS domain S-box-containing protein
MANFHNGEVEPFSIDFAALARAAGDGIVIVDPAGRIIYWNPAAERIFGYGEVAALGASLDLIIPARYRERHWRGFETVMRTGVTRYGTELLRVPALHKDGRALSIAFTVCLLKGSAGKPAAIAAFIRDETARWNEEQALRRQLAELAGKGT